MYKKFLIIASKKDKAGVNITTQLSQFRQETPQTSTQRKSNFDFYLVDDEIIYTENLDLQKINQYDFIVFASKHSSEKGGKTLSIHAPGNWRTAELGGKSNKICKTSALFQKQIFEGLNKNAQEYELNDYSVTLECSHHGPLIDKPCIFVEIGSTETEWEDRRGAFVVAKTISDTINNFQENPYNEIAVGIGGPHYCPNFNKMQLNSNIALSHIIPKYALPLKEEMVLEAIEKTEEEVDFIVLDWKGLGREDEREKILRILDKNYLQYKKLNEIDN